MLMRLDFEIHRKTCTLAIDMEESSQCECNQCRRYKVDYEYWNIQYGPAWPRGWYDQDKLYRISTDGRLMINSVLSFALSKCRLTKSERNGLLKEAKIILTDFETLSVCKDGILRRASNLSGDKVKQQHFPGSSLKSTWGNGTSPFWGCGESGHWKVLLVQHAGRNSSFLNRRICGCLNDKKQNLPTKAPLKRIMTSAPFKLVSIGCIHLECNEGGRQGVRIFRWSWSISLVITNKQQAGKTAAEKIFNDYNMRFGFLHKLHPDQGRKFENERFYHPQKKNGVSRSCTAQYHAAGSCQIER